MNLYEKLSEVQARLKVPKAQYNEFGRYGYRSCEDILEAVKPLCREMKLVLTISDEIVMVGPRFYTKATATLRDAEKPDDSIAVSAFAREEEGKKGMDGAQVTGAASSYARKYALNGLFDIDDTKDSDATNKGPVNGTAKPQGTPRDPDRVAYMYELIRTLCGMAGYEEASVHKSLERKIRKPITGFSAEDVERACDMLNGEILKAGGAA